MRFQFKEQLRAMSTVCAVWSVSSTLWFLCDGEINVFSEWTLSLNCPDSHNCQLSCLLSAGSFSCRRFKSLQLSY